MRKQRSKKWPNSWKSAGGAAYASCAGSLLSTWESSWQAGIDTMPVKSAEGLRSDTFPAIRALIRSMLMRGIMQVQHAGQQWTRRLKG